MKAIAEVGQLAAGATSTETMTANCKRGLLQNVNSSIRCSGRVMLSTQADACARHNHYIRTTSSVTLTTDGGHPARGQMRESVNTAGTAGSGKSVGITGGSENRPRNVAFNYIVRAA